MVLASGDSIPWMACLMGVEPEGTSARFRTVWGAVRFFWPTRRHRFLPNQSLARVIDVKVVFIAPFPCCEADLLKG